MCSPTIRSGRLLAVLALALLFGTGCYYNGGRNMGATQKWVASDISTVPKVIGVMPISIVDAFCAGFTSPWDQLADNDVPKYLSYSASRRVASSDMSHAYQWGASIPTLIFDTAWCVVYQGWVDLFWVLGSDKTEPEAETGFTGPVARTAGDF